MEKNAHLSFGLVGFGNIGKRHAALIKNFGKLSAICDINPNAFLALENPTEVNLYSDYSTLLNQEKDIDIIVICTPNCFHASQSIQALEKGIDVICEKPMALSKVDCQAMIDAAKAKGSKLFIVKQNRFNPPVLLLKNLLKTGKLGRIYSLQLNCFWNRNEQYFNSSWRGKLLLDGGTLFTQFSHFVDLLAWLFGDVKEVKGFSDNFNHKESIEFEDSGVAILKFKTDIIAGIHYSINAWRKNMEGSLTVIAEKGSIKIGGEYLNRIDYLEVDGVDNWSIANGNDSNDYGEYRGSMNNHKEFYQATLQQIINSEYNLEALDDSMRTVEIVERIYANSR